MITLPTARSIPPDSTSPCLVLASASKYKQALLARLRLAFESRDAAIDESRRPDEPPAALALRLAQEKAMAVALDASDAFVLGADQVIALGDRIFEKPGSQTRAVDHLLALQGQTHVLLNAVCLIAPDGSSTTSLVTYEMRMRPLSKAQILAYLALDEPLDCAGAYRIEAAGIALFEAALGPDPTAIEGLPLTRVWTLLSEAGFFPG
jgi:septum formation protein